MCELSGLNIVVVDDNRTMLEVMREFAALITGNPDRVSTATSGSDAIRAIIRAKADVVIMDCMMPLLDGPTATSHIRRGLNSIRPDLAIILVSGEVSDKMKNEALDSGADMFLTKPFDLATLRDAVCEVMDRRAACGTCQSASAATAASAA